MTDPRAMLSGIGPELPGSRTVTGPGETVKPGRKPTPFPKAVP